MQPSICALEGLVVLEFNILILDIFRDHFISNVSTRRYKVSSSPHGDKKQGGETRGRENLDPKKVSRSPSLYFCTSPRIRRRVGGRQALYSRQRPCLHLPPIMLGNLPLPPPKSRKTRSFRWAASTETTVLATYTGSNRMFFQNPVESLLCFHYLLDSTEHGIG